MKQFSEFRHIDHAHMQKIMECFAICSACAKMCIEEGHKTTAKLCSDCADVCSLTIKLHSGDSKFNRQVCELCSSICSQCADACAEMEDEHCKQCSQACRECADACKEAALG